MYLGVHPQTVHVDVVHLQPQAKFKHFSSTFQIYAFGYHPVKNISFFCYLYPRLRYFSAGCKVATFSAAKKKEKIALALFSYCWELPNPFGNHLGRV